MLKIQTALKHSSRVDRFTKRKARLLKPIRPDRLAERDYLLNLKKLVNEIKREVEQELIPIIENTPFLGGSDSSAHDAISAGQIVAKIAELARRFKVKAGMATTMATNVANRVKDAVDNRLRSELVKSVSIDISPILKHNNQLTPEIQRAVRENVDLITTIPEQYFGKLQDKIIDAISNGQRHEALKNIIYQVGEITDRRARIIARDQVSKMNSSFNRIRQTSLGITTYKWSTSNDERVRPDHAEKEGLIFKWDDPPSDTGNPGEDIMCRCVAIPVFNLDEMEAEVGL
jgi:SPP1 gp7 family putative phage head morphogenesis protein